MTGCIVHWTCLNWCGQQFFSYNSLGCGPAKRLELLPCAYIFCGSRYGVVLMTAKPLLLSEKLWVVYIANELLLIVVTVVAIINICAHPTRSNGGNVLYMQFETSTVWRQVMRSSVAKKRNQFLKVNNFSRMLAVPKDLV